MEAKFYTALLILGLIATALAKGGHRRHHDRDHDDDDRHHGDHDDDYHHGKRRDKCPPLKTFDELPLKCNVTDNCDAITCSSTFLGKTVWLGLQFNRSQDPMIVEVSLKVPARQWKWSYTFKSGSWTIWSEDKVQVPGFPLTIKGFAGDDMFLTVSLDKTGIGIAFKLNLTLSSGEREDLDITFLQGKLPVKDHGDDGDRERHEHRRHGKGRCSRFVSWFKRQPVSVKAALGISTILVLSLVITALVYCCKKRRAKAVNTVRVKPPFLDETKVPMEPLINEE